MAQPRQPEKSRSPLLLRDLQFGIGKGDAVVGEPKGDLVERRAAINNPKEQCLHDW